MSEAQCDLKFISRSRDFALYLENYFIGTHHTLDN